MHPRVTLDTSNYIFNTMQSEFDLLKVPLSTYELFLHVDTY